jgi:hypothetical protein
MWLYDEVSDEYVILQHLQRLAPVLEKYLQAARALVAARLLHAEHPELHIRTVEFRKTSPTSPTSVRLSVDY